MSTVYVLTLRQLTSKWRLAIMTVLAVLPAIIALAMLSRRSAPTVQAFETVVLGAILCGAIAPLVVLAMDRQHLSHHFFIQVSQVSGVGPLSAVHEISEGAKTLDQYLIGSVCLLKKMYGLRVFGKRLVEQLVIGGDHVVQNSFGKSGFKSHQDHFMVFGRIKSSAVTLALVHDHVFVRIDHMVVAAHAVILFAFKAVANRKA